MKSMALLLGLFVGLTQAVTFSNCCQGTFCSQKDNCPPCPKDGDPTQDDCCGQGLSSRTGDPGCVHPEPTSELEAGVNLQLSVDHVAWLVMVASGSSARHGNQSFSPDLESVDPRPSEGPPDLYLRHHAILI